MRHGSLCGDLYRSSRDSSKSGGIPGAAVSAKLSRISNMDCKGELRRIVACSPHDRTANRRLMVMLATAHFSVELGEDLDGICVHCPRFTNEQAIIGPKVECATIKVATLKAILQTEVSHRPGIPVHVVPRELEKV